MSSENKLVSISVIIDKDRKVALKYWANYYGISLSEYVRLILLSVPLLGVYQDYEDVTPF